VINDGGGTAWNRFLTPHRTQREASGDERRQGSLRQRYPLKSFVDQGVFRAATIASPNISYLKIAIPSRFATVAPISSLSDRKTCLEHGMKRKHLPCLEGIRARAVAMVFIAHAGLDKPYPAALGHDLLPP
jgi:hypothetical protein